MCILYKLYKLPVYYLLSSHDFSCRKSSFIVTHEVENTDNRCILILFLTTFFQLLLAFRLILFEASASGEIMQFYYHQNIWRSLENLRFYQNQFRLIMAPVVVTEVMFHCIIFSLKSTKQKFDRIKCRAPGKI